MEKLKAQLYEECPYPLPGEIMDQFLTMMTPMYLKRNEPLIECGKLDTNIYILKEGILRLHYLETV